MTPGWTFCTKNSQSPCPHSIPGADLLPADERLVDVWSLHREITTGSGSSASPSPASLAPQVAAHLASHHGIGVRDGLFRAHPMARRLLGEAPARLGQPLGDTAVRASIGRGNTAEHVDRLLTGLRDLIG
jgi:hypothetical protein